jgi:hypothetical protein
MGSVPATRRSGFWNCQRTRLERPGAIERTKAEKQLPAAKACAKIKNSSGLDLSPAGVPCLSHEGFCDNQHLDAQQLAQATSQMHVTKDSVVDDL